MIVYPERTNKTILSESVDAGGDPLTVVKVNGQPALIGVPISLSVGGAVTIASDGVVTFDARGFTVPDIGDYVADGVIATISDGINEVETSVNLEFYGALQDEVLIFGALTRRFHGGVEAPQGANSIVNGDPGEHFAVSNGMIFPTLAGEGKLDSNYVLNFDNDTNRMVIIQPDTFSVTGDDELEKLLSDSALPYDGKVISLRPGQYMDHIVPSRTYTQGLTLQGDPDGEIAEIRSLRIERLFGEPDVVVQNLSFGSNVIEKEFRHRLIYDINTTPNGTLTIQKCHFHGANGSDPSGDGLFPKIDYSDATAIPAVGETITSSGGAETFIREVHDNGIGSGTLYVSDNPSKTIGGSARGDLWTAGQVIIGPSWSATTTSGLYGGMPFVGNGIEGQLAFREMTVEGCLFNGLKQAMEVNATHRIIVRGNASKNLLSDFIKVHSGTTPASDLTLIERNLHKNGASSSDDYGNPHRDVIQISGKKLVQHWTNFIVRDNMFLTGPSREPGMQALFLATANKNNFGLHGAVIKNNLVEVGPASAALAFDHAYSSTIENNVLLTALLRNDGGAVKARIGYSSGDGLNRARGNVCEAFKIDGTDAGNVTNPKYTDYSVFYPGWTGVLDFTTISEVLERFTPAPGTAVMADSTWSMSTDHGCVDEAGRFIGHDLEDLTQHFIDLNGMLDNSNKVTFVAPIIVPPAFDIAAWNLTDAGVGRALTLSVLSLPDDSGSAIIDLEISIDGNPFTSLGGSTTGDYMLSSLADDVEVSVLLRAVNAIGAGGDGIAKTATPTIANVTLTINDFAVDDFPYDARASFGENTANVPLSGTALPDTVLEARAKELGGAFTTIATADSNGNWSGALPVLEDGAKYHAEVREVGVAGNRTETTNRFSTGNISVPFAQSEYARIDKKAHDGIPHPTVTDPDALVFLTIDHLSATNENAPAVLLIRITDNEPRATAALKYMSNAYARHAPGKRFVVCDQMESGTSLAWLIDDNSVGTKNRNRHWSVLNEMVQNYLRDSIGTTPSVGLYAWWSADRPDYGSTDDVDFEKLEEALAPVFWGETIDGAIFTKGNTGPIGYDIDHMFFDNQVGATERGRGFFANNEIKFSFFMNGFIVEDDLSDLETKAAGGISAGMRSTRFANLGLRQFLEDPRAIARGFVEGHQGNGPLTGKPDSKGDWQDYAHPAGQSRYGLSLMAEILALNHMSMCGFVTDAKPQINNVTWSESGAIVDVTIPNGQALTTHRTQDRSLPAIPAQPWRQNIAGFEIERNGIFFAPNKAAIIDDGTTNANAQIAVSYAAKNDDVLHYMRGGGTGQYQKRDMQEGYWANIAGSTIGNASEPLSPLQNLPTGEFLTASGIAQASGRGTLTFTTSLTGPYFCDQKGIGTTTTALTFVFKGQLTNAATLLGQSATQIDFRTLSDTRNTGTGLYRLTLKTSGGTKIASVISVAKFPYDTEIEVRLVIDLAAGTARLFHDDVEQFNGGGAQWTFVTSADTFVAVRRLSLLAKNNGSQQAQADITRLAIWKTSETDGSEPLTRPYKEILANEDLSLINNDNWKLGDDTHNFRER